MSVDMLVSQLDGVRRTGDHRWIARCPAHDDKHPSLAIRELADGRVLLHDFAGCDVESILAAIGLTFDALFPESTARQHRASERRPFPAVDVFRAVEREVLIVAVAASVLGNGVELTDDDRTRLLLASSRLMAAVQESGHG